MLTLMYYRYLCRYENLELGKGENTVEYDNLARMPSGLRRDDVR